MQPIISKQFINQNIQYHDDDGTVKNYSDFCDAINKWKYIFVNKYHLSRGDLICFMIHDVNFEYNAAFFAAAEAGLVMITPPDKPVDSSGHVPKLDQMLGDKKIDLSLTNQHYKEISPNIYAMASYYSKQVDFIEMATSYAVTDIDLYNQLANAIACAPDDLAVITTTSGTTGDSKKVTYTHSQLYHISVRNSRVFDLEDNSVCHARNMHHAFVLYVSFLPAFYATKIHYKNIPRHDILGLSDADKMEKYVQFIIDKQISKVSFANKPMLDCTIKYMADRNLKFAHKFDVIVGGYYITEDYVQKIQTVNINRIISNFGSNETLGPLLLRTIDQNTSTEDYKINYIGTAPDDFYSLELIDQCLYVTCPLLYSGTIKMADTISQGPDGYYHIGRDNLYRINEVEFNTDDIDNIIKQLHPMDFDFRTVVDMAFQRIYLPVWYGEVDLAAVNAALKHKYGSIEIHSSLKLDKKDYFQGFKPDFESMRETFRKNAQ